MKKLFLIPFFVLAIISCQPEIEDNRTECQKENAGYFAFDNNSKDAYDIFVNGTYYKQMPGNTYTTKWIKYPAGKSYTIKVQQVSGYLFTPTVKSYNVTLNQCDEKTISFP